MPALLLLFVAFGLLVLAGTAIGRMRGQAVSRGDALAMSGMTGVALGFLLMIIGLVPQVFFPGTVAVVLTVAWLRRGELAELGAFLIGGGLIVAVFHATWLANDLADPAVSLPGWSPIPLAAAVGAVVVGTGLVVTKSQVKR